VLAAFNNDPRFVVRPIPGRDNNNFQPRLGFNWNPQTRSSGLIGWLTGGDKLVVRGGYTRTHDYAYTNILLNIWSSFPFVAAVSSFPTTTARPIGGNPNGSNDVTVIPNAFTVLQNPPFNPNTVNRTIVDEDFHMPTYDSVSLEVQREFTRDLVLRVGYVGTKGTSLFESVDANPAVIGCTNASAANQFCRSIPNQGPTRLRTNSGMSNYHSLQTSLEKRLSRGFSAGLHYTYSSFIDTMSEIFNVSSGEIAVAQDSYNRAADRARSSFDRPHRIAGNFVYELPWFHDQKGAKGLVLGGWQFNSQFSLQSGSPFTPLNGSDPADEMRSRARNERRVAQGGGERAKRDAKADEANLAKIREKNPSQYYFIYKTKIKNNHTAAITQIDWDYVFYERDTENELGRQQFTSDEHVGPGKTKELTVTITSPPTRTVSVTSLNLEEHDRFTEKIILIRVQYADGRVWQAP
jgi:hypothetical protein